MKPSDSAGRGDAVYRVYPALGRSLLSTKLYMPPQRTGTIRRTHLVERLNTPPSARLIVISAPAGFGKTTVAAEWLSSEQARPARQAAWLQLEEGDNDVARFWRYIIAAFQTVDERIGARVMDVLAQPSLPTPEAWLPLLLNDLADAQSTVLVLDDYHSIHNQAIHQSIYYFLQHLPPGVQLALLGRADPPLPLARMRVQEELLELRGTDLRFTPDEVEQYLNESMSLGLSAEDVALLTRRTEGWPAGVQLAAQSLRGYEPDGRAAFIRSFSGSDRYVINYLMEEVLQQQPPELRHFLLCTSILTRLSAPLCATVSDQPEAKASWALHHLDDEHLFIIPLDAVGHWYRYHALFAESLQTQLRESDPDLWNELHRRASDWCARNGHVERAIDHALTAQDYDAAATFIEMAGERTWATGGLAMLLTWLSTLPRPAFEGRISLRLLYAWVLFLHDRWSEATALWEETGAMLEQASAPSERQYRGRWAAIGASMAAHRQEPEITISLAQQALALLPPDDRTWCAVSHIDLGLAYHAQGSVAPAARILRAAADLSIAQGNAYLAFAALGHLGDTYLTQGRLHEAQATWERLQQIEEMPGGRGLALHAHGSVGLAQVAYERDDLLRAERLLSESLERIWPGGQPRVVLAAYITLAAVYAAQGKYDLAGAQLEEGAALVQKLGLPAEGRLVDAHQAWLALREGRMDDVVDWSERAGLSPDDPADFRREMEHRVLAMALIAQGKYALAESLAARLRGAAERLGRQGSVISLHLLHALALAGLRRLPEADAVLRRGILLGEPQGYVRTFVDMGASLAELLRQPAVRQQSPLYVNQLLNAFDRGPSQPSLLFAFTTQDDDAMPLLESLTPREEEILRLVALGASNQAIADQLVLSVGTVKGHVNHIFSKLGVHSRTAAVARARQLGIIES